MRILLGCDDSTDVDKMHEYYFSKIWRYPRTPSREDPDCE